MSSRGLAPMIISYNSRRKHVAVERRNAVCRIAIAPRRDVRLEKADRLDNMLTK
jgi:hypothetical protein